MNQQVRARSRSSEGNQDETQSSGYQAALRSVWEASLCVRIQVQLSKVHGQAQAWLRQRSGGQAVKSQFKSRSSRKDCQPSWGLPAELCGSALSPKKGGSPLRCISSKLALSPGSWTSSRGDALRVPTTGGSYRMFPLIPPDNSERRTADIRTGNLVL